MSVWPCRISLSTLSEWTLRTYVDLHLRDLRPRPRTLTRRIGRQILRLRKLDTTPRILHFKRGNRIRKFTPKIHHGALRSRSPISPAPRTPISLPRTRIRRRNPERNMPRPASRLSRVIRAIRQYTRVLIDRVNPDQIRS